MTEDDEDRPISVEDMWAEFAEQLPKAVRDDATLFDSYRTLFHVGAYMVVTAILERFDDQDETAETSVAYLERIEDELQIFGASIVRRAEIENKVH